MTRSIYLGFILFCIFLLGGQSFFYISDFTALYFLSKSFFILGVVFFVLLFPRNYNGQQQALLIVVLFLSLFLLSSLRSIFSFEMSYFNAAFVNSKLLASISYFVFPIVFFWLFSKRYFAQGWLIVSCFVLVLFYLIYWIYPPELYWVQESDFIVQQSDKNPRYRMPVYFLTAFSLYFISNFNSFSSKLMWVGFIFLFGFILFLVFYHQQRMYFYAFMLISFLAIFNYRFGLYQFFLAGVSIVALSIVLVLNDVGQYFDGSLGVRLMAIELIYGESGGVDFFEYFFGVGYGYSGSGYSIEERFGEGVWLSDLGWLGIFYEYGLAGVLIGFYFYWVLIYRSKSLAVNYIWIHYCVLHWFLMSLFSPAIIYSNGALFMLLGAAFAARKVEVKS